jgi:hypothetical protein
MRQILLPFILILIIGCQENRGKQQVENLDFKTYINQLETIPLPFAYSSKNGIESNIPILDDQILSQHKKYWNDITIGKLFVCKDYTIIVEREIGDFGPVPIFITYDKAGNKLGSFNAFSKAGEDMGYSSSEFVIVDKSLIITVIDSTVVWELNSSETDIIEDSDSLSVGQTTYKLDFKGIFNKN